MIAASLSGKKIAITGSTGFVGTALVERLLRSVPDCHLVLLIRDGKRTSAAERARKEILKNDAFDRLRAEHGADFDAVIAARITTVSGDVTRDGLGLNDDDRAVWASCDTIIHSAAAVSFDLPLDSAVEINLLGPMRIAATFLQLVTIVCAVFALIELQDNALLARWLAWAVLAQLATIALLLFDRH